MLQRMLCAVVLITTLGCDAFYTVRGVVRSCADKQPIAGAKVLLTYPDEKGSTASDATGTYNVSVNDPPGVNAGTLTAEAPGYARAERTVHHSYDESQDVCLEPTVDR